MQVYSNRRSSPEASSLAPLSYVVSCRKLFTFTYTSYIFCKIYICYAILTPSDRAYIFPVSGTTILGPGVPNPIAFTFLPGSRRHDREIWRSDPANISPIAVDTSLGTMIFTSVVLSPKSSDKTRQSIRHPHVTRLDDIRAKVPSIIVIRNYQR